MITYIGRRFLWIIPVLFTVSIITFFLMHAVPGGPWDREKRLPRRPSGPAERQVRARSADLHPVPHTGPASSSRATSGRPTATRTARSTTSSPTASGPPSSSASWPSSCRSLVGIPLGIFAALGHNRWPGLCLHERLHHRHRHAQFRAGDPADRRLRGPLRLVPDRRLEGTRSTGSCRRSPWPASRSRSSRATPARRCSRSPARTTSGRPTARASRDQAVVSRHMIRNALIPVVTILGPTLAFLVTGSFIIETDLRHPGHRPVLHHVDLDA